MSENASHSDLTRLRKEVLLAQARISELEAELANSRRRLEQERNLTEQAQILADRRIAAGTLNIFESELTTTKAELARVFARMMELDAERRAMQQSRSWRWTAPVRSIERWFSRRGRG